MWVKICANTNLDDALAAARLGADAIGFVFAPSTRQMTAAGVRPISEALPEAVERVGVFGAGTAKEIAAAATEAGLNALQLHGGSFAERVALGRSLRELLGPEISIIQTVHWPVDEEVHQDQVAESIAHQLAVLAEDGLGDRVLVDTSVGGATGGTGRTFDWQLANLVLRSQRSLKIIVAGGLRPENVAVAIHSLAPWGVDVASGVERRPGFKDLAKLQDFIEKARGA